jgi:hypothetical protein
MARPEDQARSRELHLTQKHASICRLTCGQGDILYIICFKTDSGYASRTASNSGDATTRDWADRASECNSIPSLSSGGSVQRLALLTRS